MLTRKLISCSDRVLVVCGGKYDRDAFENLGFENVVISNLDHHGGVSDYSPYLWELQDAEQLTGEADSFDWVFVHAGLHHCGSPHKGLCEMMRVAKRGVGVFEARDSFLVRLGVRFGFVADYELEPVALSEGKHGGYRNSAIPNFVYRWTEREVEKTVNSGFPAYEHKFHYFYRFRLPTGRLSLSRNPMMRIGIKAIGVVVPLIEMFFRKQGNQFAFVVTKRETLHPWLLVKDVEAEPNMEYFRKRFDIEKYQR